MTRATDSPPTGRHGRSALRIVAAALAGLLVCAVGLVAALWLVPPVRVAALREGLSIANDRLPGTMAVEGAAWPRLNRVALSGVTWVDAPDTLASAQRLELAVSLRRLLRRKYTVRALHVERLRADVPAIRARFATPGASDALEAEAPRAAFDPDSLLGFVVEDLQVDDAQVRVTPTVRLAATTLKVRADLRGEGAPRIVELSACMPLREQLSVAFHLEAAVDDSLVVRLARVHVDDPARLPDPSTLPMDGRIATTLAEALSLDRDNPWPRLSAQGIAITGALGDLELEGRLQGREPGHVRGRLAPQQPPPWLTDLVLSGASDSLAVKLRPLFAECWPQDAPPTLTWDADFTPPQAGAGLWPFPVALTGDFVLPGPGELAPYLPAQLRVSDLLGLRGRIVARYAGTGDSTQLHVDLDLAGTRGFTTGRLRAASDGAHLGGRGLARDTTHGLTLRARGRLDRQRLDATATADVSSQLLARWDDPALRGIHGGIHADVSAAGAAARTSTSPTWTARSGEGTTLPAVSAHANLDDGRLVLALVASGGSLRRDRARHAEARHRRARRGRASLRRRG
jgi:hypothetical protein